MDKKRADQLVIEQGLAKDLKEARALILAGEVICGGTRVEKAGSLLDPEAPLQRRDSKNRYVSRGGLKLESALAQLGIEVAGWVCVDLGASTGGFTDCLLRQGAAKVYACDIGKGQLDWKLRNDPRVAVFDSTHASTVRPAMFAEPVDLIVSDLAYISLRSVLPGLKDFAARILALAKPQFETWRGEVSSGGLIQDETRRQEILQRLVVDIEEMGFQLLGRADSTVKGKRGNQETFLWLMKKA